MGASKSLAPLFATIKQLIEQSRNHVAVSVNAEEYGNDFAFLSLQKRITIDDGDFTIDLLFYHRKLKRLIDMELKSDKFRHEYKSQSEHYLRWLDRHEKQEGQTPLGILLCAEKRDEMIELLELDGSGIRHLYNRIAPSGMAERKTASIH